MGILRIDCLDPGSIDLLEWDARVGGEGLVARCREILEVEARKVETPVYLLKSFSLPEGRVDIYEAYDIRSKTVTCLGLAGEPNPWKVSGRVLAELGFQEATRFAVLADMHARFVARLDEGFRAALYPGFFADRDERKAVSAAVTAPRAKASLPKPRPLAVHSDEGDAIVLKPYTHLTENWDPDAIK